MTPRAPTHRLAEGSVYREVWGWDVTASSLFFFFFFFFPCSPFVSLQDNATFAQFEN